MRRSSTSTWRRRAGPVCRPSRATCSSAGHAAWSSRPWAAARRPTLRMVWLATRIGMALGAFVLVSAVAELLGAANLGTALGFGQLGFVLAVAFLIIRT